MHKTLTGLVAVAALAVPASAFADSNPNHVQSASCTNPEHSLSLTGSRYLWPPNHKFRDYTVSAISQNPLDTSVMLSSTVSPNELATGRGSGGWNHANYAEPNPANASNSPGDDGYSPGGNVSETQSLRSERDGFGSGRTYTFTVSAVWNMSEMCKAQFTVVVPHDMRNGLPSD